LFGGQLDAELINDLINDISRDSDQLPILQHVLVRMWEEAVASNPRPPSARELRADASRTPT
jgi:hypothetical protein